MDINALSAGPRTNIPVSPHPLQCILLIKYIFASYEGEAKVVCCLSLPYVSCFSHRMQKGLWWALSCVWIKYCSSHAAHIYYFWCSALFFLIIYCSVSWLRSQLILEHTKLEVGSFSILASLSWGAGCCCCWWDWVGSRGVSPVPSVLWKVCSKNTQSTGCYKTHVQPITLQLRPGMMGDLRSALSRETFACWPSLCLSLLCASTSTAIHELTFSFEKEELFWTDTLWTHHCYSPPSRVNFVLHLGLS